MKLVWCSLISLSTAAVLIGVIQPIQAQQGNCDPSYPDLCLAPPPPDLNCGDISARNFQVVGSDPHGFDRDKDGVGCEE